MGIIKRVFKAIKGDGRHGFTPEESAKANAIKWGKEPYSFFDQFAAYEKMRAELFEQEMARREILREQIREEMAQIAALEVEDGDPVDDMAKGWLSQLFQAHIRQDNTPMAAASAGVGVPPNVTASAPVEMPPVNADLRTYAYMLKTGKIDRLDVLNYLKLKGISESDFEACLAALSAPSGGKK